MTSLITGWYRGSPWLWILWPLERLFAAVSSLRRQFYRWGWLRAGKPDATIIVIGNLSVGGNGKTPVVIALTEWLIAQGYRVGVLSRGYGATTTDFPYQVKRNDQASLVGDEPLLMALRTHASVVIDPDRRRGAQYLVNQLECNVVMCDDGMQHYGLQRDIEVVVMDERQLGNQHLLPMGPLREGAWRLKTVNMILHNAEKPEYFQAIDTPQYGMRLTPAKLINVAQPEQQVSVEVFRQRYDQCSALAGIGNPRRFFHLLERLELPVSDQREFADHHRYTAADIPSQPVLMTEKDAVKVREFAHPHCWYLPVSAELPEQCYADLLKLIKDVPKN